jgi:hypothetical protein
MGSDHQYFMQYVLRRATLQDRPALQTLIAVSARQLSTGDYLPEQVEGARCAGLSASIRNSSGTGLTSSWSLAT